MHEMTESEYLQMQDDGGADDECLIEEAIEHAKDIPDKIRRMRTVYLASKQAKVGTTITCPVCGKRFVKKSYQQAFCSNGNKQKNNTHLGVKNCKDKYWNFVDDSRRFRMMVVSGANLLENHDGCGNARQEAAGIVQEAMLGTYNKVSQPITPDTLKAELVAYINAQPAEVIKTLHTLLIKK